MNLDNKYLNIAMINECTELEGPGKRFCIWFQGCNLGCKNCTNQEMLSFDAKYLFSINKLLDYIHYAKDKYDIEGITLLGGEPFLQAKNISYLAECIKDMNLSIICFSGFKYRQLQNNMIPYSKTLLSLLDVIIDDVYIEKLQDNQRNWVGSTNQSFYYLTNKYNKEIETNLGKINKINLNITHSLFINGEASIVEKFKFN